ncbi:MAG: septum formation protein Maf [Ignavibacteriales bacterium CG12_big_fil_rev_8_21_14_0_65_30_8]|nr:MAG: septum formation protein Maf [Ignavibacteriales bacterium CG12_big_fil_rev_8_21_14_0_65_30_8]
MINKNIPVYLASKSPRRKKLLEQLDLKFKVFSIECDEKINKNESFVKTVKRLAKLKLEAAKKIHDDGIIITADTIVVLGNKIIGKPKNKKNAVSILTKLSNKTHKVYTGFTVYNAITNNVIVDYAKTLVTFKKLSEKEIKDYVSTGSPLDKAGAYGIQDDYGVVFVKKINGCYNNVIGLPLFKVYNALMRV